MTEPAPDTSVFSQFHTAWLTVIPFAWLVIQWVAKTAKGGSDSVVKGQTELLNRLEKQGAAYVKRIGELEKTVEKSRQEVHELRRDVQKLISQLVRAGIEPDIKL